MNILKSQGVITKEDAQQMLTMPLDSILADFSLEFNEFASQSNENDTSLIQLDSNDTGSTETDDITLEDAAMAIEDEMLLEEQNMPNLDDLEKEAELDKDIESDNGSTDDTDSVKEGRYTSARNKKNKHSCRKN